MQEYQYFTDNIKIKILNNDAVIPTVQANDRKISFYMNKDCMIMPNKREIFKLGFVMSFNKELLLLINNEPRLSSMNGIYIIPELIASTSKDEFAVTIENSQNGRATFKKGQKIAEGVLIMAPFTVIQVVKGLD